MTENTSNLLVSPYICGLDLYFDSFGNNDFLWTTFILFLLEYLLMYVMDLIGNNSSFVAVKVQFTNAFSLLLHITAVETSDI